MNTTDPRGLRVDAEALSERLARDAEFLHAARLWSGALRLEIGDEQWELSLEHGRIEGCASGPVATASPLAATDVAVAGSREGWKEMLGAAPRPFLHDVVAASVHEGFRIAGDLETFYAYYPAIRRVVDVMREMETGSAMRADRDATGEG